MTEPDAPKPRPTQEAEPASGRATLGLLFLGLAVAIGLGGYYAIRARQVPGTAGLREQLADRGKVAVVGDEDLLRLSAEGAELVPAAEVAGLAQALAGENEGAVSEVMRARGIAALLVDRRGLGPLEEGQEPRSVRERLARARFTEALHGLYLAPSAILYERRQPLGITPPLDEAMIHVAEGLLRGRRRPALRSFPEPLRAHRNVEIMLMLRSGGRPRLWRSARGDSIARALMTATTVARERWIERAAALGGPLEERLPELEISVHLLEEEGTLGSTAAAFIEAVVPEGFGVGYESRSGWSYLTPAMTTQKGEGSPVAAYRSLFTENRLPPDSFERASLRFYRLSSRELARSHRPDVAPLPMPELPDELLDPNF